MNLVQSIENDLKNAMLNRDKDLTDLLRLIKASFKNEMISLKKQQLSDEQAVKILKREAKKRNDSIEQFKKGNRPDLAEKEQKELELIKKYLPQEMSQAEVKKTVEEIINQMGEVAPSQFGQIMGAVMKKIGSQTDGNLVSKLVKEALNK